MYSKLIVFASAGEFGPLCVYVFKDLMSCQSDPVAVVYVKKRDGKLDEIGRTEVILNNLNPSWITKVPIAYQFEIIQPLVYVHVAFLRSL